MNTLEFANRKAVRALTIMKIVKDGGYDGCVCFSCGNAAAQLAKVVYTIRVCPDGDFQSTKWWKGEEIHKAFPNLLDATSGHLPLWAMRELASDYWLHFQRQSIVLEDDALYSIPTGSGETLVALAMAFPQSRFKPEYNLNMSTAFQVHAPLNTLVDALTHK